MKERHISIWIWSIINHLFTSKNCNFLSKAGWQAMLASLSIYSAGGANQTLPFGGRSQADQGTTGGLKQTTGQASLPVSLSFIWVQSTCERCLLPTQKSWFSHHNVFNRRNWSLGSPKNFLNYRSKTCAEQKTMLIAASINLWIKNRLKECGRMSVSMCTDVGFQCSSLWMPKSRHL